MDSHESQTQSFEARPDDDEQLWTVTCIVDEGIIKKKKMYKVFHILLPFIYGQTN